MYLMHLNKRTEVESERKVKSGILESVGVSEWTMPIVSLIKK